MCLLCHSIAACRFHSRYNTIPTPEGGLRGFVAFCGFITLFRMNTQELGNFVRNWVHYDNLTTSLSKQTTNARKVRDDFESKILQQLHVNNMENAVIQVQGGRLLVGEERHTQPLTLARIEEGIHAYFAEQKRLGKNTVDDTPAIMRFLKTHRTVEVTKRLKKQNAPPVPPLPPPPPPTGGRLL